MIGLFASCGKETPVKRVGGPGVSAFARSRLIIRLLIDSPIPDVRYPWDRGASVADRVNSLRQAASYEAQSPGHGAFKAAGSW